MNKELRDKITTTISQYLSHFESYTNGSRLDRPLSIDAFLNSINDIYQSYYADKVKKGGLELTEIEQRPYWVEWEKSGEDSVCTSLIPNLLNAQLKKVYPVIETEIKAATDRERERIFNTLCCNLSFKEYNDSVSISGNISCKDWQSLKGGK